MLGSDHQRGQYYEHCKISTKPRDLKARRSCQPLHSFIWLDEETSSSEERMMDLPWYEHIELSAKLLDYFLRSTKSNINQNGSMRKNFEM